MPLLPCDDPGFCKRSTTSVEASGSTRQNSSAWPFIASCLEVKLLQFVLPRSSSGFPAATYAVSTPGNTFFHPLHILSRPSHHCLYFLRISRRGSNVCEAVWGSAGGESTLPSGSESRKAEGWRVGQHNGAGQDRVPRAGKEEGVDPRERFLSSFTRPFQHLIPEYTVDWRRFVTEDQLATPAW